MSSSKKNRWYLYIFFKAFIILFLIISAIYFSLLIIAPSPSPVPSYQSCDIVCINVTSEKQAYNPGEKIELKINVIPQKDLDRIDFSGTAYFYDWKLRTIHQHSARDFSSGELEVLKSSLPLPFFAPPGKYRMELQAFPSENGAKTSYVFYLVPSIEHYLFGGSLLILFTLLNYYSRFVFRKLLETYNVVIHNAGTIYRTLKEESRNEPLREKKDEKERAEEFHWKYHLLNRIPIFRNFTKWMYKEGNWYVLTLVTLFIVAFVLRVWNIEQLSPVRDEYSHLIVAKEIFYGQQFDYYRGLTVSYMVAFLFKLFDTTSLFVARLVPVIIGSLTTIVIYFLGKRINKKIGIISSFLWVFAPFSIGISRYIREYSFICFVVPLAVLYILYFLDNVYKLKFDKNSFAKVSILFLLLLSTFFHGINREIFGGTYDKPLQVIALVIFLTYFSYVVKEKFLPINEEKRKRLTQLTIVCLFILSMLFTTNLIYRLPFIPKNWGYDGNYFNLYFDGSLNWSHGAAQWFLDSGYPDFFLILLFLLPFVFYYYQRSFLSYFFAFWALIISLTLYVPLVKPFFPRYAYYALPFYIIVYASSIYILLKTRELFNQKKVRLVYSLVLIVFILSIFNPITSVNTLLSEENGAIDVKTGLRHDKTFELLAFLEKEDFSEEKFVGNSILLTRNHAIFFYYYNFTEEKCIELGNDYNIKDIQNYTKKYNNGWFISDNLRNKLPEKTQTIDNTTLVYIGGVEGRYGFDVYRWD